MRAPLLAIAAVLTLFSSAQAFAAEEFRAQIKIATEIVDIQAAATPFDPSEYGLDLAKPWKLDGRTPIGGFPALPDTRLNRLEVRWGDRSIPIPQDLISDLFDPKLGTRAGFWDSSDGLLIAAAHDSLSILVEMKNSASACCGYRVIWVISKSGDVTRFVTDEVP